MFLLQHFYLLVLYSKFWIYLIDMYISFIWEKRWHFSDLCASHEVDCLYSLIYIFFFFLLSHSVSTLVCLKSFSTKPGWVLKGKTTWVRFFEWLFTSESVLSWYCSQTFLWTPSSQIMIWRLLINYEIFALAWVFPIQFLKLKLIHFY